MFARILLLFGLWAFFSCNILDYQPDSKNFHHVEKPKPITIYFGVRASSDTLRFWDRIDINYVINSEPSRPILKIDAYVDDEYVPTYISQVNSRQTLIISMNKITNGLHFLKLIIYLKSQTGSLADNLDMEAYVITKEYPFYFDDRGFSGKISIQTTFNENHLPVIEWTKYPYDNFQKCTIFRTYNDTQIDTIAVIKNRHQHVFIDSSYFGGKVSYYVSILARDHVYKSSTSTIGEPQSDLLRFENTDDGAIKVSWPQVPTQKNFQAYKLTFGPMRFNHELLSSREITISDIEQCTFIDTQATFGLPVSYSLNVQINNREYPLATQHFFKGHQTDRILRVAYVPSRGDFCLFQSNGLRSYTSFLSDTTFTQKIFRLINFSPDGQWAFRISRKGIIYRVNPLKTEEVLESAQIRNLWGNVPIIKNLMVSNQGWLAFFDSDSYNNMVYDFPHKRKLFDSACTGYGRILRISSNGEYLLFENKTIYKVRGNTLLTKLHSIPDVMHFVFAEDPAQYILTMNRQIAIYQIEDKALIKAFPIERDLYRPSIDLYGHFLGGFTRGDQSFRIYNLENGQLVKEIKVTFDENFWGTTYFYFQKDMLFFSEYHSGASFMKIKW